MRYTIEHQHSIDIPEPVFDWIADNVPNKYRIAENKIQYQYSDNHYIMFYKVR